jgi:hypothetical protein
MDTGHVRVPDWRPDQHKIPVAPTGAPPAQIIEETPNIPQMFAWPARLASHLMAGNTPEILLSSGSRRQIR